jgi:hypothetical protein
MLTANVRAGTGRSIPVSPMAASSIAAIRLQPVERPSHKQKRQRDGHSPHQPMQLMPV